MWVRLGIRIARVAGITWVGRVTWIATRIARVARIAWIVVWIIGIWTILLILVLVFVLFIHIFVHLHLLDEACIVEEIMTMSQAS